MEGSGFFIVFRDQGPRHSANLTREGRVQSHAVSPYGAQDVIPTGILLIKNPEVNDLFRILGHFHTSGRHDLGDSLRIAAQANVSEQGADYESSGQERIDHGGRRYSLPPPRFRFDAERVEPELRCGSHGMLPLCYKNVTILFEV